MNIMHRNTKQEKVSFLSVNHITVILDYNVYKCQWFCMSFAL